MRNDHFNCDCLECQSDHLQGFIEDHADAKDANFYIGSVLKAKKNLNVYSSPNVASPVVKQYTPNTNVGVIYSWVLRDGFLWWQINWFSGKHQGWVLHDPSQFDSKIVQDTASGKAHEEKIKELNKPPADPLADIGKGLGDSISFFGGNLKWILIVVIIVALAYAYKAFKS